MVKFYYMNSKIVVLFVRGLPGSGKTTLSKYVSKQFNFNHINPDFFPDLYKKSERNERLRKFDLCVDKVKKSLKDDTSVVWDQPWRKDYNIPKIIVSLKTEFEFIPLILELNIPVETSWKRSLNKFNNRKEFDDFTSKYLKSPHLYSCLKINSEDGFEKNSKKLKKFLEYNITHG